MREFRSHPECLFMYPCQPSVIQAWYFKEICRQTFYIQNPAQTMPIHVYCKSPNPKLIICGIWEWLEIFQPDHPQQGGKPRVCLHMLAGMQSCNEEQMQPAPPALNNRQPTSSATLWTGWSASPSSNLPQHYAQFLEPSSMVSTPQKTWRVETRGRAFSVVPPIFGTTSLLQPTQCQICLLFGAKLRQPSLQKPLKTSLIMQGLDTISQVLFFFSGVGLFCFYSFYCILMFFMLS